MDNFFLLEGNYRVVCRKENVDYLLFDGEALEFYRLNEPRAEIVYLLYQKKNIYETTQILSNKYDINQEEMELIIKDFYTNLPFKSALINLLMEGKYV